MQKNFYIGWGSTNGNFQNDSIFEIQTHKIHTQKKIRFSFVCSVNMTAHWKLLTFMIGGNDFCSDICYQTNATQWMNQSQEKYLIKTLRFIRDNMPRYGIKLNCCFFHLFGKFCFFFFIFAFVCSQNVCQSCAIAVGEFIIFNGSYWCTMAMSFVTSNRVLMLIWASIFEST